MLALILGTAIVLEGCKKDNNQTQDSLKPNILQAKTWYDSQFLKDASGSKKSASTTSPNLNFTQLVSPDWEKAEVSKRYDDTILEVPI
jgi:hypothetical protein